MRWLLVTLSLLTMGAPAADLRGQFNALSRLHGKQYLTQAEAFIKLDGAEAFLERQKATHYRAAALLVALNMPTWRSQKHQLIIEQKRHVAVREQQLNDYFLKARALFGQFPSASRTKIPIAKRQEFSGLVSQELALLLEASVHNVAEVPDLMRLCMLLNVLDRRLYPLSGDEVERVRTEQPDWYVEWNPEQHDLWSKQLLADTTQSRMVRMAAAQYRMDESSRNYLQDLAKSDDVLGSMAALFASSRSAFFRPEWLDGWFKTCTETQRKWIYRIYSDSNASGPLGGGREQLAHTLQFERSVIGMLIRHRQRQVPPQFFKIYRQAIEDDAQAMINFLPNLQTSRLARHLIKKRIRSYPCWHPDSVEKLKTLKLSHPTAQAIAKHLIDNVSGNTLKSPTGTQLKASYDYAARLPLDTQ